MFFNKYIKYIDILAVILIGLVGYKLIDNYTIIFDFLGRIISIISPFIYALIFAYCLNPIMNLFEKKFKAKRGLAILSTYMLVAGALVMVFLYVVPGIFDSIVSITSEIPQYVNIAQSWLDGALRNQDFYHMISTSGILDNLTLLTGKLSSIAIGILNGSLSSIVSITTNLVKIGFGLLISIYILLDKEKLIREVKILIYMILKDDKASKLIEFIKTYNKMIGVYIGTKAIDSTIIGVLAFIGLLVVKAPYAILIALVVGITNMIPYFGPLVGEVIGALVGIFVSPMMAITIFILLFALQQFDAWYLDPKLIGGKVGVKPLYIILAVTIGGGFFGPIGMLLASPTIATFNIYYERLVNSFIKNRSKDKKLSKDNS